VVPVQRVLHDGPDGIARVAWHESPL